MKNAEQVMAEYFNDVNEYGQGHADLRIEQNGYKINDGKFEAIEGVKFEACKRCQEKINTTMINDNNGLCILCEIDAEIEAFEKQEAEELNELA